MSELAYFAASKRRQLCVRLCVAQLLIVTDFFRLFLLFQVSLIRVQSSVTWKSSQVSSVEWQVLSKSADQL